MPRRALAVSSLVLALSLVPAGTASAAGRCVGPPSAACLLPFPNDATQTVRDPRTPTGRRVRLRAAVAPVNAKGVRMDLRDQNRADGFSPGQPILVQLPGVTDRAIFAPQGLPSITRPSAALAKGSKLVIADARTGERWPAWAELDTATTDRPSSRLVVIHPARNLTEGRTFVVAIRGLRSGPAPGALAAARRPALRAALRRAKVPVDGSLQVAWTFTVASTASLTGRMLHVRDDAFAQLGDTTLADGIPQGRAPSYAITKVTELGVVEDAQIARKVEGTITVPCYLDRPGCPPGARFRYASRGPDALPAQAPGNVIRAPFACIVPRSATPAAPARLATYGHGLLGSIGELDAGNVHAMAFEHDIVFCATPEIGMAREDVPTAISILGELGRFPALADRLQQGLLDGLYLQRLLRHPQGLSADPALRAAGQALTDPSHVYYDSNSQGAIFGGALMALAPDVTRGVLGVAGMDYGLLLPRSTDFAAYAQVLYPAYPRQEQRMEGLSLIQMLWDRGETDGYAAHVTADPLPDTPVHRVLLHAAVGDKQVSNWTADVEARTMGVALRVPAFDAGRSRSREQTLGLPTFFGTPPGAGSALVYWDSGPGHNAPADPRVRPPAGRDPHEDPRSTPAAREQKSGFLTPAGVVADSCGGRPCHTAAFSGAR